MVSDMDLELQECVILKFELPTVLLRFCPVCGFSISEGFQLKEIQEHFSECLGVETSIAVKSSKDIRKFRKELKCRSCDKKYGNSVQLEKHRFFCENTVNLADYESVEVIQQLEDIETRTEDGLERTEDGFEVARTEDVKEVKRANNGLVVDRVEYGIEASSEDIGDGLRLEAVEEKENEHLDEQLVSGSEYHPRSNPSLERSPEVLLDKDGGNFDHIDESQTILPMETKPVSEVGKPISKIRKPVSEIQKPVSEIQKPVSEVEKVISQVDKPVATCSFLECDKLFSTKASLRRHLDSVHLGNKVHSCSYCTKAFKDKTSLRHHVQGHTDARPFSCKTCSKSFRRKESLQYHENTHLNIKSFICSQCAKSFKNLRDLKHHEKIIHSEETGQSVLQCINCTAVFRSKHILKKHQALCHGTGLKFVCSECKQTFITASALKQHSRTHSGDKPFQCTFCSKSFRRKFHLEVHSKRHDSVREFRCPDCNKSFPQKAELRKHAGVHATDKFKCSLCDKTFPRLDDVKQHMKKHKLQSEIDVSGLGLLPGMQTISVKTEKYKTEDDVITTKTVYVMEPDVPGGSSTSATPGTRITIHPWSPQLRSDKEVGETIVISSSGKPQGDSYIIYDL